ncbi:MAG: tetraacyldisaccharide 4'-kinase [Pseudomonadota bacterium]
MKAPDFWWRAPSVQSRLLYPISSIYGTLAKRPFGGGVRAKNPVLCIGNFVAGGAGKTPAALAFADIALARGLKPVFLSRGYGGQLTGPHRVDAAEDTADAVGDEPLLLAQKAPTVIARDRPQGLAFIEAHIEHDLIIMDDGFQSSTVMPDHAALVVDAKRGLGNGCVMPAGPLRAPLAVQMRYAGSLLVIRGSEPDHSAVAPLESEFQAAGKPVMTAQLKTKPHEAIPESPIVAFSGIGDPEKFFSGLEDHGCNVVARTSFPDHHVFAEDEASELLSVAANKGATLATTAKDAVRLKGKSGVLAELRERSVVFDAELSIDQASTHAAESIIKHLVAER